MTLAITAQPEPRRGEPEPCSRSCILAPPGRQPEACCKPGWRKGHSRQEGRDLRPFPHKHILHRLRQCHTGPTAGIGAARGAGGGGRWVGCRRSLVLLCLALSDLIFISLPLTPSLTGRHSAFPKAFPDPGCGGSLKTALGLFCSMVLDKLINASEFYIL